MIFENIKLAMSSIRANKMRSFLTMLGMIIGISSVIAIVSLGDTMRSMVASEYENFGSGLAYAYISPPDDYYTENDLFTKEDGDQLKEAMDGKVTCVSFRNSSRTDVKFGRKKETVVLTGLAENPTEMKDPQIVYGRMLNDKDILDKKKFVVLESSTALNLYGQENAVGKTIKTTINNQVEELLVIGVYVNTDSALMKLMNGGSFAEAYIPESIMMSDNDSQWAIYFWMAKDQDMPQLQSKIRDYIARMKNQQVENVVCYSAQEEMGTIDSVLGSLSAVVGAIAAISLVVGGIGIMNIMLVSVTERTREIGIRKALGARTRDIMIQFLIEAAAISAAGGIIGTILGISVVAIGGLIVGVGVVVKPVVVLIAVAFSAIVGLGFGLYPAKKAAKKDPVEALRYE
ncbi:macrolide export ATP-binding/permease protein MacB [Anaerotignum neopropionicum]|uniref:Macrolide export ATP-binding/permease protein MacB n=1 Tax=Anaerotignum neopropionicum TaxID=36847 RepID=A0A136WED3_9FIRM|nr:ABC transporter permease [Anaerotignum neopropionicum]KXL52875.1 macrolide export ATP-binding/permease protein MacB [Anaerotignum neopropionicum]